MDSYIEPIKWGLLIFPFVAAFFTIPYVLFHYHKYGSVPMLRVVVVYSFILYLICAYFLVILPLPPMEEVVKLKTPQMQLVPFAFVSDFLQNTSLVITNPQTYLKALTEPWFYQVVYNVLLFVPFGLYLRYYFKCSFLKTLVLSFLLSLFFELTQLSGLYGYYPRSYRLFDVDDLMINTLGGVFGFLTAGIVLKILPNRDELDSYAYKKGQTITIWRRLVNFMLDLFLFGFLTTFLYCFTTTPPRILGAQLFPLVSGLIYYIIIPIIFNGQTLGKKFLKMKLVDNSGDKPKFYQYILRYILLFWICLPLPFILTFVILYFSNYLGDDIAVIVSAFGLIILAIFSLIYYLVIFIKLSRGKTIWYERVSKTRNISTIKIQESEVGNQEEIHKNE